MECGIDYRLLTSVDRVIKEGSLTGIMIEIMKISKENGIPKVTYDLQLKSTCFEFEGMYCDFKLYLKAY